MPLKIIHSMRGLLPHHHFLMSMSATGISHARDEDGEFSESAMYFLSTVIPQHLVFAKSFTNFRIHLYNPVNDSVFTYQFMHFAHFPTEICIPMHI
jgi:hypothetical protein